jgi:tripartite-type tricarboxylate transporter receptor subunit TctC
MRLKKLFQFIVVISGFFLIGGASNASNWPERQIRLVIPFPAGGSTDIVGRLIGEKLSARLGQTVIIDNRAGAGGTTGADVVSKSAPDGYTFLLGTSSTHTIAPNLYSKISYNPIKDFSPVSLIGLATILVAIHPSVPALNINQLIAYAKANPGKLTFGSTGNGSISHLTGEYFKLLSGADILHVPYKGDAPMTIDLVSGRVSMAFGTAVAFLPYVKSGQLSALAVTNAQPSSVVPDVATVSSSGLPGFESLQWFGVFAPAATPEQIINKMNFEIVEILKSQDVRDKLQGLGIEIVGDTPLEFTKFLKTEDSKWSKIIKDSNARID